MGLLKNFLFQLVIFGFYSCSLLANQDKWIPGEYVVKLNKHINTFSNINSLSVLLESKIKSIINNDTIVIQRSVVENSQKIISMNLQNPLVKIIEPNFIYTISDAQNIPNDPHFINQWGLNNTGQNGGTPGVDIDALKAWKITTGSKKVIVAIIDTGVDREHPELKENMWINETESNGAQGIDDDKNGVVDDIYGYDFFNNDSDPSDDNGHGTFYAGIIGAKANNGFGITGINWDVSIMPIKFLSNNGSGSLENAIRAIDYASRNNAKILTNPWGGGSYSEILKQTIENTYKANQLFVAPAGAEGANNDLNPVYPASYDVPNIISVASIHSTGKLSPFSNWGSNTVHVAAPGSNIYSFTSEKIVSWSGSMGCSFVSGISALLIAFEPTLSAVDIKERLIRTSKPLWALKNKVLSGGIVSAYYALTNQTPPSDPNNLDHWKSTPIHIETSHPYKEKEILEWVVEQAGAKRIAIHFSKFETENGFDKIEFFDANKNSLGTMSGLNDDMYSPVSHGEKIIMKFSSDGNIQLNGFIVDKIVYDESLN